MLIAIGVGGSRLSRLGDVENETIGGSIEAAAISIDSGSNAIAGCMETTSSGSSAPSDVDIETRFDPTSCMNSGGLEVTASSAPYDSSNSGAKSCADCFVPTFSNAPVDCFEAGEPAPVDGVEAAAGNAVPDCLETVA
jgi:hypothetical protein